MNTPVEVVEITPTSGAGTIAVIHDRADWALQVVCSRHDGPRGYRCCFSYGRGATVNDISLACAEAVAYGAKHAKSCKPARVPLTDATSEEPSCL